MLLASQSQRGQALLTYDPAPRPSLWCVRRLEQPANPDVWVCDVCVVSERQQDSSEPGTLPHPTPAADHASAKGDRTYADETPTPPTTPLGAQHQQ
jgi:hypothetical protein